MTWQGTTQDARTSRRVAPATSRLMIRHTRAASRKRQTTTGCMRKAVYPNEGEPNRFQQWSEILASREPQPTSTLFFPEIILPEQFYTSLRNAHHAPWLVALMRAILEDAINCFQRQFVEKSAKTKRLANEAEAWLWADDERWPLSFVNVCALLRLEPCSIRTGLFRWRESTAVEQWAKRRRITRAHAPTLKIAQNTDTTYTTGLHQQTPTSPCKVRMVSRKRRRRNRSEPQEQNDRGSGKSGELPA